jgi:hypothetical protein
MKINVLFLLNIVAVAGIAQSCGSLNETKKTGNDQNLPAMPQDSNSLSELESFSNHCPGFEFFESGFSNYQTQEYFLSLVSLRLASDVPARPNFKGQRRIQFQSIDEVTDSRCASFAKSLAPGVLWTGPNKKSTEAWAFDSGFDLSLRLNIDSVLTQENLKKVMQSGPFELNASKRLEGGLKQFAQIRSQHERARPDSQFQFDGGKIEMLCEAEFQYHLSTQAVFSQINEPPQAHCEVNPHASGPSDSQICLKVQLKFPQTSCSYLAKGLMLQQSDGSTFWANLKGTMNFAGDASTRIENEAVSFTIDGVEFL